MMTDLTPRQQIYLNDDIINLIYSFAITSYRIRFTNDVLPYIDKGFKLVKLMNGIFKLCDNCYLYDNYSCPREHNTLFTDYYWMSYDQFNYSRSLISRFVPPFHFYLDFNYFLINKKGKKILLVWKKMNILIKTNKKKYYY
jgi:hypothetical protein